MFGEFEDEAEMIIRKGKNYLKKNGVAQPNKAIGALNLKLKN